MLKPILLVLVLASTLAAMPPVNSPSEDVVFETFGDSALNAGNLRGLDGKIVIITYFTPW